MPNDASEADPGTVAAEAAAGARSARRPPAISNLARLSGKLGSSPSRRTPIPVLLIDRGADAGWSRHVVYCIRLRPRPMRLPVTPLLLTLVASAPTLDAQRHVPKRARADTLRGSFTTPWRSWWDATFYDLHVDIRPNDSTIAGRNGITYRVLSAPREMQIDLMEPLVVDSMVQDGRRVRFRREGAAHFAALTAPQRAGEHKTITVYYHGRPQIAKNPPWQGGFT